MAKTKKPTGLTVTRNGDKYTIKWKKGDSNYSGGQGLQYRLKTNGSWKSWQTVTVSTSVVTKTVTVGSSSYYPTTAKKLNAIEFRVRGKRSGRTYSDWSNITYTLEVPRKPTISSSLGNTSNVLNAPWEIVTQNDEKKVFNKYEWQSILVHDSNETDGSKLTWAITSDGWRTGTGASTSGTITITEDSSVISSGSHTRWIRIRSNGVAGSSDWKYTKHVYAIPLSATISNFNVTEQQSGYIVDVSWVAQSNASRPIDQTSLEYAYAIPIADMQIPSGASWEIADTSKDTSDEDRAVFVTNTKLADDECLFVRVVTTHDNRNNYSDVALVHKGSLAIPTNLVLTENQDTITVEATNNSTASTYTGSDSSIKRLFLEVLRRDLNGENVIGIIPTTSSSVSVALPSDEYSIGVRAVVGTYSLDDGIYSIEREMQSESIWGEGDVPIPPANVKAEFNGNIVVTWDWSWSQADSAELSWSKEEDAWESTEEPDTYEIGHVATRWIIKDFDEATKYYVKVRLKSGDVFSSYSDIVAVDMTLPPQKPSLKLSSGIITEDGNITASWNYVSNDGTDQSYAEIVCDGEIIAHTETAKYITIYAKDNQWEGGNSYDLSVRVKSESGSYSDYSDSVSVSIATPLQAQISNDSLEVIEIHDDEEETRQVVSLTEMPLLVTVTGGNSITLAIERAEAYHIDRPDENSYDGYEGETIYLVSYSGQGEREINIDDIYGNLDDGAKYRIIATVVDSLGQSSTATKEFEVHWTHQAIIPQGDVEIQDLMAVISPIAPTGAEQDDVCDIYRLSADKPELIYPNAIFGESYTDPYPAINGSYRLVFKTANGDYITEDGTMAWLDIESGFEYDNAIIDFGNDSVELYFNVDTDHQWSKDFKETKYLGGSIQGDWNPSVSRSTSISSVTMNIDDKETISALRRLAVYSGICNVRTLDGSSFHANVEVSESNPHDRYGLISEFSLNITRVDPQGYDGILSELEG